MSKSGSEKIPSANELTDIYHKLFSCYGNQQWWPADDREEVIIGAILTQNTNWLNVTRALQNLKKNNLCSLHKLASASKATISELIKPSGYYNLKADRLQNCAHFLKDWQPASLTFEEARRYLLAIKGIGPETADSILLYAFHIPVFVIDTYTIRLLNRFFCISSGKNYSYYQSLFMNQLTKESDLYNEYHALIVQHCKSFCRRKPLCDNCPINSECLYHLSNRKKQSD
ncbi:MAG: endonuclease III domain-containing protein [Candidatus Cloacimonetes bacterium]|nr:endonuclease III domain-containing protein [Candidatus Cloacimonadota bacterium]